MDDETTEGKERKEEGNCVLQRRFRPLPAAAAAADEARAAETTSEAAAATVASEVAVPLLAAAAPSTGDAAKAQLSPRLTQCELSSVLRSVEEDYTRKADFREAYPAADAADGGGGGSGERRRAGGRGGDLNSQVVISGPLPPPLPPLQPPPEKERTSRDNNPDHGDRPDHRVLHGQGRTERSAVLILPGHVAVFLVFSPGESRYICSGFKVFNLL